MGTLLIVLASFVYAAADMESELPTEKRFDVELKRSIAISDHPEDNKHNEDIGILDLNWKDGENRQFTKKFDPYSKRFDPFTNDLYKRFDPYQKRFDIYKRFDPYVNKRFDVYKRFDPFQKRFDLYKRFDPFDKRFDPLYKRFDPFFKRFDPYISKRFDREETVRNLLRSLSQSKRNIIDPRAFNIGFGR